MSSTKSTLVSVVLVVVSVVLVFRLELELSAELAGKKIRQLSLLFPFLQHRHGDGSGFSTCVGQSSFTEIKS